MKKKMDLQKAGGFAALFCGIAYMVMIVYFLVIIDYPSVTDPLQKIQMFTDNYAGMFATYLLGYAVFGILLAVISLALYDRLKDNAKDGARLIAVFGIMWGVLVTGSGMVFIQMINTTVELFKTNPDQAITVLAATESVALGLSFSDGELLGGLWTLLIGIVALRTKTFNKPLNIVAIVVGSAGILSTIPMVNELGGTGIYGIGQMVWYVWLGVILIKDNRKLAAI